MKILGEHSVGFVRERDLVFHKRQALAQHPNGMRFSAHAGGGDLLRKATYFSVAGGFVVPEGEELAAVVDDVKALYPFASGAELLDQCREHGLSISTVMLENERVRRSEAEVREGLLAIWGAMRSLARLLQHSACSLMSLARTGGLMRTRSIPFLAGIALLATLGVFSPASAAAETAATAEEARSFVAEANATLAELNHTASRAAWIQSTYITDDTEAIAAMLGERATVQAVEYAKASGRFDDIELPAELRRQIEVLKRAIVLPTPKDPDEARELSQIAARMQSHYGRGKWCPTGESSEECLSLPDLSRTMASSRDAKQLLDVWQGWRASFPELKPDFVRYVELANKGSRQLGYADFGAMWRSKYDMDPDAFAAELDRLWGQVRPLYLSLHAYVRTRLREQYGADVVPADGPIPAHLLGNMWAQQWANIEPLVAPADADPGFDLTERLKANELDAVEMVRYGQRFFTSLGFEPLPESFWERSLFTKPRDREVVCHASAWDVDDVEDLRIKMCIEVNADDFSTIHHELGHNFYQRAYNPLPYVLRGSANDGFHEAVGDTLALSVTPGYLKEIGLIDVEPDPSKDIGLLLRMALDKIAFLPFGLLVDQWRFKVFSGDVGPDQYNRAWWELREKVQGIAPPVERSEMDFDPAAKYHVSANVSYTRYFLAHILQFQFHRSLCEAAGYEGPLNRCSIYGNAEAGQRLAAMLEMGMSRPWPDALEALTGQREMDATAILDYFARSRSGWTSRTRANR